MKAMRRMSWLLALAIGLAPADPAGAALIRFKNGTQMRGTIVQRSPTEVVVQLDFGTVSFTPDEIVAVEEETSAAPEAPAPAPAQAPPAPAPAPPPDPAIAPRPSAVGGMVVQPPMGGRDVAPIGAGVSVPRALPVGLHTRQATPHPPRASSPSNAMRAIAHIGVAHDNGSITVGSGVVINDHGIIVTNYHVIMHATNLAAMLPRDASKDSTEEVPVYDVRILKTDPCYDLAVLSIPVKTPDYLRFADDDAVRVGDTVRAVGNPEGKGAQVSRGIVSAVRTVKEMAGGQPVTVPDCAHLSAKTIEGAVFIQTDATIDIGTTGGPLLNARDEIAGINAYGFFNAPGLNFALHAKHVKSFVGAYLKQ